MKNYPKPLIQDIMKSLYYLYQQKYINYPEFLGILNVDYDVHHVDVGEENLVCYQYIDGKTTKTSIPI